MKLNGADDLSVTKKFYISMVGICLLMFFLDIIPTIVLAQSKNVDLTIDVDCFISDNGRISWLVERRYRNTKDESIDFIEIFPMLERLRTPYINLRIVGQSEGIEIDNIDSFSPLKIQGTVPPKSISLLKFWFEDMDSSYKAKTIRDRMCLYLGNDPGCPELEQVYVNVHIPRSFSVENSIKNSRIKYFFPETIDSEYISAQPSHGGYSWKLTTSEHFKKTPDAIYLDVCAVESYDIKRLGIIISLLLSTISLIIGTTVMLKQKKKKST